MQQRDLPASDLAIAAARSVIAARRALGWSQRELAARAGVSQSTVSRFERVQAAAISLDTTSRIFAALGIRADLQAELPIVARDRRQRDAVHAREAGYVGRRLTAEGWEVRHEVEVGSGQMRGWVDILGYRPDDRSLLTTEIKSDLPDIGATQRTVAWYGREAWQAARRLGWHPVRQVLALLALDSAEVEGRIRDNRELLAASFPGRAAQLQEWIRDPSAPIPLPSLALIDPAWRGRTWLRGSRIDGRRSPSRYVGYRDALDRTSRR